MESQDICQRCQIKPIVFYCENCRPFTLYCSQCDTSVHSLPLRMNHLRKQIANSISSDSPRQKKALIEHNSLIQKCNVSPIQSNNNSYHKSNHSDTFDQDFKKLQIENKKLKEELINLSHQNTKQEDIKEDLESFYDTKLSQLEKENNAFKEENNRLEHESYQQSSIITQLQKEIEQMNLQIKDQYQQIQIGKEKRKDSEGFYKFKFEEMQKEKDYLMNQIRRNTHNNINMIENNRLSNYKEYGLQLPIKENNKG